MAAQKHLLLRGLFSPQAEAEDQRFHGLPPLKRFKILQKEKTHLPHHSPYLHQDDPLHRPVQVCCLPAKKRVCALQFFASMADEEETDDKENEMAPFKKIIGHSFGSASPSSDPAILQELASNNCLKLAPDNSRSVLNSKISRVSSSVGPLNTSMHNVSASAQKNAECNKKMIRPSEPDKLRESEKKVDAKKTSKLSKVSEETSKKTKTNSVQLSSKVMKTDKEKTEKKYSKDGDRHISSKKESLKENVETRERKREEATNACLKMGDDHSSLSRKREESVSREADEEMKLKKGDLVNEKDLRRIDANERKREELIQVSSRKKNDQSSSSKRRKDLESMEGRGDLCLKKRELVKERDGRLSELMKRNAESSQKINLKKKDDLSSLEKRNILETKVCLKKKPIFVNEKELTSVCPLKKDGDDHQLTDLKKVMVNRDCSKLKGEEYPREKLCLKKKKKRIQLKGNDPSKLCVEEKGRFKSKLCVNKEYQFKRNSPLKISVDNKDQFKRHNSLTPCVENKDKIKGHDTYISCVEKKDNSCSEENKANVCCLKKAQPEETMGSCAVSAVKGQCSNGELEEFSKDQSHHTSNVLLEDCTKSDKDCYTGEYNTCKETQNAYGEEDRESKEVDENEDEEDGVFCDVCMEEDADEEDPIVFCDGCNVMVHASCYGYPLIDGIPEGDWFCKQCMEKKAKQNTLSLATVTNINDCDKSRICCLCPKREGAMKETTGGGWAHLSCALFVPEVFYRKAREREEIECSQVPSWRWNLPCIFCKKDSANHNKTTNNSEASIDGCGKGACIQCTEVGCTSTFHVSCAMDAGLSLDIRIGNGVSKTPAIVIAFCPAHTQQALSGSEKRRFKIVPRD